MSASFSTEQDIRRLFRGTFPTLQKMASTKAAIFLWYNFLAEKFNVEENYLDDFQDKKYYEEVEKSLQQLIIPHLIKARVKECLIEVEKQLNRWIGYNKFATSSHLNCCVWLWNGNIDYNKTAQKIVSLPDFTSVEKFLIMCIYCLENEIKNLSLDAELENYLNHTNFCNNPLIYYWKRFLKNEIHYLSLQRVRREMLTSMNFLSWSAVEYFWDHMSEQDQIEKMTEFIVYDTNFTSDKQLLFKMNDLQLHKILQMVPDHMIVKFGTILAEPETAFAIWIRIRNSMTDQQFRSMITKLLFTKIPRKETMLLAIKILDSANNEQQKKCALEELKEMIHRMYFNPSNFLHLPESLKLLKITLLYSSLDYRKDFILTRSEYLLVNSPFFEVDEIIKLCLSKNDEITQFKKQMMKSMVVKNHCNDLFEKGEFRYLNEFVKFYSPDEITMKQCKQQILEFTAIESVFTFKPNGWSELEKFIENVYPDVSSATKIKKQFIVSSEMNSFFDDTNIEILHYWISITSHLLTNQETAKMKETLLGRFHELLTTKYDWESFNEIYWTDFTNWCLDDENKVEEFKMTLYLDEIFDNIMKNILEHALMGEFNVKMLEMVDGILKWYFVEPKLVKEYKLQRIFTFNDVKIVDSLISKINEQYVRIGLTWFLDNDQQQISIFKSKFSNEKVSKLV